MTGGTYRITAVLDSGQSVNLDVRPEDNGLAVVGVSPSIDWASVTALPEGWYDQHTDPVDIRTARTIRGGNHG